MTAFLNDAEDDEDKNPAQAEDDEDKNPAQAEDDEDKNPSPSKPAWSPQTLHPQTPRQFRG